MYVLGWPFQDIDEEILSRLAADRVPESRTHDYTGALPAPRNDEERDKFLEKLASFANTEGGVLICGFNESQWEVRGLRGFNPDGDVRRVEQLARRLDPPLAPILERRLTAPSGDPVLLLGVAPSFVGPHAVVYDSKGRVGYFRRNNRGKYAMETSELRRAFLEADAWRKEALGFRDDRIRLARDWPAGRRISCTMIAHLLPLGRLEARYNIEARRDEIQKRIGQWILGSTRRMNVDGLEFEAPTAPNGSERRPLWVQCFRHGGAELGVSLERMPAIVPSGAIDGSQVHELLRDFTTSGVSLLEDLSVSPPYVLLVSLCGVYARRLTRGPTDYTTDNQWFDRHEVLLPGLLVAPGVASVEEALAEAKVLIRQAAGYF